MCTASCCFGTNQRHRQGSMSARWVNSVVKLTQTCARSETKRRRGLSSLLSMAIQLLSPGSGVRRPAGAPADRVVLGKRQTASASAAATTRASARPSASPSTTSASTAWRCAARVPPVCAARVLALASRQRQGWPSGSLADSGSHPYTWSYSDSCLAHTRAHRARCGPASHSVHVSTNVWPGFSHAVLSLRRPSLCN